MHRRIITIRSIRTYWGRPPETQGPPLSVPRTLVRLHGRTLHRGYGIHQGIDVDSMYHRGFLQGFALGGGASQAVHPGLQQHGGYVSVKVLMACATQ